jgi:hypothetical protein
VNIGALIFMLAAWAVVLGLAVWSFWKLLRLPPLSDDESAGPDGFDGGETRAQRKPT